AFGSLDEKGLPQRDWLEIFDFHALGERHHRAEFVYLAHSFIEDGGDNPSVRMSGWTLIATGETEAAPGAAIGFIEGKLQPHAIRIVSSAAKAVVLSYFQVPGVVAGFGERGLE